MIQLRRRSIHLIFLLAASISMMLIMAPTSEASLRTVLRLGGSSVNAVSIDGKRIAWWQTRSGHSGCVKGVYTQHLKTKKRRRFECVTDADADGTSIRRVVISGKRIAWAYSIFGNNEYLESFFDTLGSGTAATDEQFITETDAAQFSLDGSGGSIYQGTTLDNNGGSIVGGIKRYAGTALAELAGSEPSLRMAADGDTIATIVDNGDSTVKIMSGIDGSGVISVPIGATVKEIALGSVLAVITAGDTNNTITTYSASTGAGIWALTIPKSAHGVAVGDDRVAWIQRKSIRIRRASDGVLLAQVATRSTASDLDMSGHDVLWAENRARQAVVRLANV